MKMSKQIWGVPVLEHVPPAKWSTIDISATIYHDGVIWTAKARGNIVTSKSIPLPGKAIQRLYCSSQAWDLQRGRYWELEYICRRKRQRKTRQCAQKWHKDFTKGKTPIMGERMIFRQQSMYSGVGRNDTRQSNLLTIWASDLPLSVAGRLSVSYRFMVVIQLVIQPIGTHLHGNLSNDLLILRVMVFIVQ